jgi:beta-glucanase (GH16 family)
VADWAYDTGAGLWGTGEIENYCAAFSSVAPCNAAQPNTYLDGHGNLVIQAIENHGAWTSGRLLTKGRHAFQYGRIEARMKLPAGAGFWPAFWMLGSNIDTVQWPQCGEIDIMEWVQSYTRVATSSTVHGPGYSGPEGITSKFTFSHHETVDDSFHTYGVIWTKDKLQFYRDSPEHPYLTVTPAQLPPGAKWVYNQPFFLLLNFAIGGGGFAGNTDSTTPQTGTVLVDYVRVYQELAH